MDLVVGRNYVRKISKSIKNRQNPVTNVSNMVKSLRKKFNELGLATKKNWNKSQAIFFKKQPKSRLQEETALWTNVPECQKISYKPDLLIIHIFAIVAFILICLPKTTFKNFFD